MTLRIVEHDRPLFELPPRAVFKVYGTENLHSMDWDALAKIPGAFVPLQKRPEPADDLWVSRYYLKEHQYPKVLCIPRSHLGELRHAIEVNQIAAEPEIQYTPQPTVPTPVQPTQSDPMTTQPYVLSNFQYEATQEFLERRRLLIALPIGSGKTLIPLSGAEALLKAQLIDRCIIVGSRTIIGQPDSSTEDGEDVWRPIVDKFYHREAARFDGTADHRIKEIRQVLSGATDPKYILTTFDQWRVGDGEWLKRLLGPRTMVTVDEVHHLKNPKTQRFKSLRKAMATAPGGPVDYRVLLSGSLNHDKVLDVFGPIGLMGLHVWNDEYEFKDTYFNWQRLQARNGQVYYDFNGFKTDGAARLNATIEDLAYHRTRGQLDMELPPLRPPDVRKVKIGKAERQAYEYIQKKFDADMDAAIVDSDRNRVFEILTAQRLFGSDPGVFLRSKSDLVTRILSAPDAPPFRSLVPGAKFRAMCKWLAEFLEDDDGKVVIFTPFEMTQLFIRETLSDVERCEEVGIDPTILQRSVFFSGDLKQSHPIRQFRKDPQIRIMWSTDAGAEGLNYQDVTAYCVHYDDVWSHGTMAQREGRVYRRGQTKPVLIVSFHTDVEQERDDMNARRANSQYIDHRIRKLLDWKAELKGLLDGQQPG